MTLRVFFLPRLITHRDFLKLSIVEFSRLRFYFKLVIDILSSVHWDYTPKVEGDSFQVCEYVRVGLSY